MPAPSPLKAITPKVVVPKIPRINIQGNNGNDYEPSFDVDEDGRIKVFTTPIQNLTHLQKQYA